MKTIIVLLSIAFFTQTFAQPVPDLLIQAGAGAAEVWNDSIYFFGGSDRWGGAVLYPRIYKYNGNTWRYYDSIPDNNMWDVKSVIVEDDVYLLSGWRSGYRLIRKYNLSDREWTYLNNGPNPETYGTTAEYVAGFIYHFNRSGNVYEYDIANDIWTTKIPNIIPGYDLSSIVYQNEIYIIGFYDSTFFKYSPATNTWTQLAKTIYPISGCSMNVLDGFIYCAGGSPQGNPSEQRNTLLVYNIQENSWHEDEFRLMNSKIMMADVIYRGEIYLLGGFDSSSAAVNTVERIIPTGPVSSINESVIPSDFMLYQNYPNPFNPATTIKYMIKTPAHVKLSIYNLLGENIVELADEYKYPGSYEIKFDASNLSGGMYFIRLKAGTFTSTKKCLLLK
ncbi:MAG: T9SS type A sorting domain-containing protein [Calditrichaceae bacterium]|nr:T9SS type A sorting domain-containing protein [Calditrichaceae bacterium]MBN2709462.1 T9SS type A sorting domain-containing protein [Calditrichaceae bacterium]RQV94058.1 MAG: T9SS C-terminal target domain-containing protein [Calditrichota bacterium]